MRSVIWGLIGLVACAGVAHAWGFDQPGPRLPVFINPTPNGGAVVQNPGQLPTFINPTPNGGSVIQRPGQLPTFCNPTPNGGMVCH